MAHFVDPLRPVTAGSCWESKLVSVRIPRDRKRRVAVSLQLTLITLVRKQSVAQNTSARASEMNGTFRRNFSIY